MAALCRAGTSVDNPSCIYLTWVGYIAHCGDAVSQDAYMARRVDWTGSGWTTGWERGGWNLSGALMLGVRSGASQEHIKTHCHFKHGISLSFPRGHPKGL
jgi:hypothetical protein